MHRWTRVRKAARTPLLVLPLLACGDAVEVPKPETAAARPGASTPTAGNAPPRIRSIELEPGEVRAGDPVRIVLDAFDPDGDPLRIDVRWSLDGTVIGSGQTLTVPERSRDRQLRAEATVHDGTASVIEQASLFVQNTAPEVISLELEPETPTVATPIHFEAEGADPDGDPLRFEITWTVDGEPLVTSEPVLPSDRFERGSRITAEVRAHDGVEAGPAKTSTTLTVGNAPPVFTSSPGDFTGETTLRSQLRAEDPDGDRRLRFALVTGPTGLELDPVTGAIEWTPEPDQAGSHRVEVTVDDGAGGIGRQEFELSVGRGAPAAPADGV